MELVGAAGIESLEDVPDERHPLFLTACELLSLLDGTLAGRPFLSKTGSRDSRHAEGGSLLSLRGYFDEDSESDCEDAAYDDFANDDAARLVAAGCEEVNSGATGHAPLNHDEDEADVKRGQRKRRVLRVREATFVEFSQLWPRINSKIDSQSVTASSTRDTHSIDEARYNLWLFFPGKDSRARM